MCTLIWRKNTAKCSSLNVFVSEKQKQSKPMVKSFILVVLICQNNKENHDFLIPSNEIFTILILTVTVGNDFPTFADSFS